MRPQNDLVKASKFLSLVLRHDPARIGLQLDSAGWADVADLIQRACDAGVSLDEPLLREVVMTSDKQRFALSDDGLRIRANQGHSIAVELGLRPLAPPDLLYHGTADRFIESIRIKGLVKQGRQHVHLSADAVTASNVGVRHGRPVVLTVSAQSMHVGGLPFFQSENRVWLTDHVPAKYISFPNA